MIDWKTSPREYLAVTDRYAEAARAEAGRVFELLAGPTLEFLDNGEELFEAYLGLLLVASEETHYIRKGTGLFLIKGRLVFPSSPEGVRAIKLAERIGTELIRSPQLGWIDGDSPTGVLLTALDRLAETDGPLLGWRNDSARTDHSGLVIGLNLSTALVPVRDGERTTVPAPLLAPKLEGLEMDADEVEEWRQSADACVSGTVDFLQQVGVDAYGEGGLYECDSCGTEHETDEDARIEMSGTLTLDDRAIRLLEKLGYADSVREYLSKSMDADDDWESALADETETLARWREQIGRSDLNYDVNDWKFEVDFSDLEDELEGSELIRAVVLQTTLGAEYRAAGKLPPMSGWLVNGNVRWYWDGERHLQYAVSSQAATLRVNVLHGGMRVTLPDGRFVGVGADGTIDVPCDSHVDSGALAPLVTTIVKGALSCGL